MDAIDGLDRFNKITDSMADSLNGPDLIIEATDAAGQEIFKAVASKAKGTILENLVINTVAKKGGARSSIQVKDSARGGEEHHAVFLEYGTSKMAAQPFMRPSYDVAESKAVDAFSITLASGLEKL